MKNIAGKVAFVTGGASGLGLAMVQSFTAAGMKVVIADVEEAALEHSPGPAEPECDGHQSQDGGHDAAHSGDGPVQEGPWRVRGPYGEQPYCKLPA